MKYRPEIDGLRAIAVLSVLLYHARITIYGHKLFLGGYVGVDIFFVISGYLISSIIFLELTNNQRLSFVGFYRRRAQRILPMLIVTILLSQLAGWYFLMPHQFTELGWSSIFSLLFSSNFFFYFDTTKYGAESSLLIPLLHTWSLGIEEQFYILFPPLLLLTWRTSQRAVLLTLLLVFIFSLLFAQFMTHINHEMNFFLPLSRFWELTAGSLVAYKDIYFGKHKDSP